MDSNIETLLNKYWNGETSLDEEKQLREYFSTQDVPEHLKETASLFRYFEDSRGKAITDISFDRNVLQRLNTRRAGKTVSLLRNTMRMAAGVAVLIVAGWLVRNEIWTSRPTDGVDDPEVAYEETKKALLLISRTFNAAEEKAKKVTLFNEAQEEIMRSDEKSNL